LHGRWEHRSQVCHDEAALGQAKFGQNAVHIYCSSPIADAIDGEHQVSRGCKILLCRILLVLAERGKVEPFSASISGDERLLFAALLPWKITEKYF
jgi:hypothetical protein